MHPIVRVEKVNKRFQRGSESIIALDDVSFAIDTPEIVALAGPSGSGKSTLLNLLAKFDTVDSGKIYIGDKDLGAIRDEELDHFRNCHLGFVFQQFNLIKVLSASENVELAMLPQKLPKDERKRRAAEILDAVGLSNRLTHRPDQISGGQQQRVAIARALVNRPKLIIADEPTGNLDSVTGQGILELLRQLNRDLGTTIVIATHDQRVMDMAHRVIKLSDGRATT
jgi:ABC-type lipoprotein export system ATPase subunit